MLLDVSGLAYRSFYTTGMLSHSGVTTGAVYGVLRYARRLHHQYPEAGLVWCFDRDSTKRKRLFPTYKASRMTDLEDASVVEARRDLRRQLSDLENGWLPAAGYANVLSREGYEADDVIAQLCNQLSRRGEESIIVSSDHDLWQMLGEHVSMLDPKGRLFTVADFRAAWKLEPEQWVDVKALAGCKSDNVIGVPRVGERTAAKHLRGILGRGVSRDNIGVAERDGRLDLNRRLVKLPFPGVGEFKLQDDDLSDKKWNRVARALGMKSLMT